jgi:hypothetical protein
LSVQKTDSIRWRIIESADQVPASSLPFGRRICAVKRASNADQPLDRLGQPAPALVEAGLSGKA